MSDIFIKKYKKKPIIVEAIQFFNGNGKENTISTVEDFIGEKAYIKDDGYDPWLGQEWERNLI